MNNKKSGRPTLSCDTCKLRGIAERRPSSLLGAIWKWHTAFCPGWKKYVRTLHEYGEQPPAIGSRRGYWADK